MFHPLPPQDYAKVKHLFTGLEFNLIITAVFEGTSPGTLFVDDVDNPTSCYMDSAEGLYAVGRADNAAFNAGLKAQIENNQFAEEAYAVLECSSAEWPPVFDAIFEGWVVHYPRFYYTFQQMKLDWRSAVPEGFAVQRVDKAFLERTHLKNMDEVVEGYINNWVSQEAFLQDGFGFCLVNDEAVISWCMSDCVSGSRCEIGIHTDPRYQKRGFASLTVSATVDYAVQRGLTEIGWHCWEHNVASWKVAEKVGLERRRSYDAYLCLADQERYLMERGVAAARKDKHDEALAWYRQAESVPWAHFLMARSYITLGQYPETMKALQQAVDMGWDEPEYLLNPVFTPLHDTPEWQMLFKQVMD